MKQEAQMKMVHQSCRFRVSRVAWVRRFAPMILVYAIVAMVTAPAFADVSSALNSRLIESRVWSIGLDQRVAARLTTGQTVRGRITAIDTNSLTLRLHRSKPALVIPYSGVADVTSRHYRLPWVIVGIIAGTAVLMVVSMGPPSQIHHR